MLHPDLQKLIELALDDGEVTEKERQILHRKAVTLGQDIDELDIIIEGKLRKLQNQNEDQSKSNYECPNCGSTISRTAIKCGFCNFEVTKNEISGKNYIELIQKKLEQIDKDAFDMNSKRKGLLTPDYPPLQIAMNKASVITTFTMPNDKENLIEFFLFCDSNANAHTNTSNYSFDGMINKHYYPAWSGKAKMGYEKLILFAEKDEDAKRIIDKYKNKYGGNDSSFFGRIFKKK
jgi:ribosomal protein L37AE/L43A